MKRVNPKFHVDSLKCITVYRAKDGWRWHMKAKNGRIVAESGEAYSSIAKCDKGAKVMIKLVLDAYNYLRRKDGRR